MELPPIKNTGISMTTTLEEEEEEEEDNPNLLHSNGFINCPSSIRISNLEMIALQTISYTSLKDLLPAVSPAAPSIASPTPYSSWNEIPIKNPLVKQAALAYLQPMSSPPGARDDNGLFGRLKRRCCGECGCFSWINDVVLKTLKEGFWGRRRRQCVDYEDYEDYDDEEEEEEKVD